MKKLIAAVAALAAFASVATVSPDAGATNYSLWIHGYTGLSGYAQPSGWQYWQYGVTQLGVNAVPVNYDGTVHIAQSSATVVGYLNSYCTGSNWCYISAHSMGAAQIGYAVAHNPTAWNIAWVTTGGAAAGGSELANSADWALGSLATSLGGGAIADLTTSFMRNASANYNHDILGDQTGGVWANLGGDWTSWDTCFFPGGGWACPTGVGSGGGNDRAVGYHSSGLYRSVGNYGSASANGAIGGTYWDKTYTNHADNESSGSYTHFTSDSNGGIMAYANGLMQSYAK
jgi:hypothetical protein